MEHMRGTIPDVEGGTSSDTGWKRRGKVGVMLQHPFSDTVVQTIATRAERVSFKDGHGVDREKRWTKKRSVVFSKKKSGGLG